MFGSLMDFFGGKKLLENFIPIRDGKLKIILKERNGERYIYMRFSYTGNIQYHALHKENIDKTISTLCEYRKQM